MNALKTATGSGRALNPSAAVATGSANLRASVDVLDHVAVLRLDCPPPSLWDAGSKGRFIDELSRLAGDPDLQAVVLHGRRLFEEEPRRPPVAVGDFHDVLSAIANCRIPVVAAITGNAVGAGLELALACAGRVASPASTFALPGVLAGRLPRNGALERLPRLVGVEAAAELIVFGRPLDARTATEVGMIDALASRSIPAFAAHFAASALIASRNAPARLAEPEVAAAQLYGLRVRLRQQLPDQAAPLAALKALDAAVRLPGRRVHSEAAKVAAELAETPQAAALAYAEAGAMELGKVDDLPRLAAQLQWPMLREAVHLLDEGACPGQVDRCLTRYGFAEGPFARADREGLAAIFSRGDGLAVSEDWLSYSATLDLMADAGRHGGPGSPGWYRRLEDGAGPGFDPEVDRLLQGSATFQRLHRAPLPDETVTQRCLYAAVNGAAVFLEARHELNAALIDAVWTTQLGFPRWKGGPLFEAAQLGWTEVVKTLEGWRKRRNTAGPAGELLLRMANEGQSPAADIQ